MRKLMYVTIGFVLACALKAYVKKTWILLALAASGILLVSALKWDTKFCYKVLAVTLGCGLGLWWFGRYQNGYLHTAMQVDGMTLPVSIRAMDYGEEGRYGSVFTGTVKLEGEIYQVQAWLDDHTPVEPGMRFAGRFSFRSAAPQGEAESAYRQGNGIFLLAYQEGTATCGRDKVQWYDHTAKLRREIQNILESSFPEDTGPFAKALLLGDTKDLSYEVDTDLKVSGIRHVVAVSGLHISILFSLIGFLTFRKRFWMTVVGLPALFLFAALAGFSPSVTRACIMSALMLLAALLNREYDGPTALSFALLVMLARNPMAVVSVSLQLSAASVAGIFLFGPDLRAWLLSFFGEVKGKGLKARLIRWFVGLVSVTVSAVVLTTPLCAYYFDMVSLVNVLTNLLTLWIVSTVFYGIMAVCILFPALPAVAEGLAWVVSLLIRYVLRMAKILSDFPLAAVYTANPYIIAWLVFLYVLLAVFLGSNNRKPGLLGCCGVLGLCLALLGGWKEAPGEEMRFTMLDVGQGQCLLLQSDGKTFVVDCGGDSAAIAADAAAEALLSQGISRLDGLILTHLDDDHAAGAKPLLSRMETDHLILPPVATELPESTKAQVLYAYEDMEIAFGDTVIRIYAAPFPGNSNEKSLCVLFDTEKCDILITGDRTGFGERTLLRYATIPDVDVLVAGHHGAEDSTCEELLSAVKPETVLISAGKDNPYGHPAPELIKRLQRYGCAIYRTDIQGTITIRR